MEYTDISPADRACPESPYFDGRPSVQLQRNYLDEAAARGLGRWKGDPASCPMIGEFIKVTLPSMQEEAARMRAAGAIEIEHGCLRDKDTGAFAASIVLSR
eukprot:SAG31_NODE_136_length_23089_cov_8.825924_4_plen_101_part_00